MAKTSTMITMGKRGVVTIPKPIREAYHLDEGSHLTLLDLDGVLVLRPGPSEVDALAAEADYIVTLDKAHWLGNKSLPVNIADRMVSPGDFLSVFRSHNS